MKVGAIIVAAGRGERAGSRTDKVLQPLGGLTVLHHAVMPFLAERRVRQIVLVTPTGREDEFLWAAFPGGQPGSVELRAVAGGARRQDSVLEGLKALTPDITHVAIHDAARPLHRADLLTRLLDRVQEMNAVVPVVPVTDTLLEVSAAGRVLSIANRDLLRAVQTPQVFLRDWIEAAHRSAVIDGLDATDDASLILALKRPVTTVPGQADNLKLTTEADFELAEAILHGLRTNGTNGGNSQ